MPMKWQTTGSKRNIKYKFGQLTFLEHNLHYCLVAKQVNLIISVSKNRVQLKILKLPFLSKRKWHNPPKFKGLYIKVKWCCHKNGSGVFMCTVSITTVQTPPADWQPLSQEYFCQERTWQLVHLNYRNFLINCFDIMQITFFKVNKEPSGSANLWYFYLMNYCYS